MGETYNPSLQMTDSFTHAERVKIATNFLLTNSAMIFTCAKNCKAAEGGKKHNKQTKP